MALPGLSNIGEHGSRATFQSMIADGRSGA